MKNNFMDVIFTDHALQRLSERGIAQSDAWYTFKHPDQQSKGQSPNSYKYSKSYGQQKIEVIVKQNEKKEWVVLSVWSKLIGSNQPIFSRKTCPSCPAGRRATGGGNWFWQFLKKKFKKLLEKQEA